MITLETLTAADVKRTLSSGPNRKAPALVRRIMNQTRRGDRIAGDLRGGDLYHIEAWVDNGKILATCSCPYDWGGYCKHIGALLLKWIAEPGSFSVAEGGGTILDLVADAPPRSKKPNQLPAWLNAPFAALRATQTAKLHTLLEQYRVTELRALAAQHNWSLRGTRKADIVAQLAAYLTDQAHIAALLAKLSPAQRATLNALVIVGNTDAVSAEALMQLARRWHPKPAATLELMAPGLTLPADPYQPYLETARSVLPAAVVAVLQPHLALLAPAPPPAEYVAADPAQLLRHVGQLLLLLGQRQPPLTSPPPRLALEKYHRPLRDWRYDVEEIAKLQQAGKLSAMAGVSVGVPPPVEALTDDMLSAYVGSAARLDFYYWLLHLCDLVYTGSPVRVWQEVQQQYVQKPPTEQHALLVHAYFSMQDWSELWEMLRQSPALRLQREWLDFVPPSRLAAQLQALRQRVLRLLASLPADQWLALADIEALLRPIWPTFDSTAAEPHRYGPQARLTLWQLTQRGGAVDWAHGQQPFLQQVITALHWLGLADIGHDNGRLTHVRLRGLADLFWLRALVPVTPAAGQAQLRAEGTQILVAPNAISGAGHAFLDTIGRLVRTDPAQFAYQLDAAAVHAAFEEGLSLNNLLATWQQHFDSEPPAVVREQLAAWWTRYGEVRIYDDVALIEFGDDHALDEMRAVTSLDAHLVARLSPRVVLIRQAAVDLLATELQQAGYTPKVGT